MSVLATRRPEAKPVSGACRWLRRPEDGCPGLLEINGTAYAVVRLTGSKTDPAAPAEGFRLLKADGSTYDVDAEFGHCTCPDSIYRQRECKHAKALKVALAG